MSEVLKELIERIEKLGNGGANADAVSEIKNLASRCRQELNEEQTDENDADANS